MRSYFLLIIIAAFLSLSPQASAIPIEWHELTEGLESAHIGGEGLWGYDVEFIRATPNRFQPRVIRAADFGKKRWDAKSACSTARSAVCINANFFDENGDPLGVVISQGTLFQKLHKGGNTLTGVFSFTKHGAAISHRNDFVADNALEAVQAGPRLISQSTPVSGIKDDSASRRSGVCIDSDGRLLLYVASRRLVGIRIEELQSLLRQDGISCSDALNLDGGGSSQMYINQRFIPDGEVNPSIQGKDPVPVFLALFQR